MSNPVKSPISIRVLYVLCVSLYIRNCHNKYTAESQQYLNNLRNFSFFSEPELEDKDVELSNLCSTDSNLASILSSLFNTSVRRFEIFPRSSTQASLVDCFPILHTVSFFLGRLISDEGTLNYVQLHAS